VSSQGKEHLVQVMFNVVVNKAKQQLTSELNEWLRRDRRKPSPYTLPGSKVCFVVCRSDITSNFKFPAHSKNLKILVTRQPSTGDVILI
jgi:hypothetical protein